MTPSEAVSYLYLVVGLVFLIGLVRIAVALASRGPRSATPAYRRQKTLLTPPELRVYQHMRHHLAGDFAIAPKVRLADLITPARGRREAGWRSAFARITQKHADLAVFRAQDGHIVAVVEIDDSSHQRADRRARDEFFNDAFASADIPVFRLPSRAGEKEAAQVCAQIDAYYSMSSE